MELFPHRVCRAYDCKDTEKGLEKKIKMNNCIKCLLLLHFFLLKVKIEAINERMLYKWDYSYNSNLCISKKFYFKQTLK